MSLLVCLFVYMFRKRFTCSCWMLLCCSTGLSHLMCLAQHLNRSLLCAYHHNTQNDVVRQLDLVLQSRKLAFFFFTSIIIMNEIV